MLLFSDGFDSHATGTPTLKDGDDMWGAQVGVSISSPNGRFGGKALTAAGNTAASIALPITGTNVAFAAYWKVTGGTVATTLAKADSAVLLARKTDGTLEVRDGAGTLRITTTEVVASGDYAWIEVSYRAGGIYINIAGAPAGEYIGAYTAPTWASFQVLDNGTDQGAVAVDDLLVWDDQGAYFNTYALAPRRIHLLRPDGDGTLNQWTPAGATNWQSVDAVDWTGGAGVTAATAGQVDRYSFTPLGSLPGSIDAVVTKTRAENIGSSTANIVPVSNDGTANTAAAAVPVPVAATKTVRGQFFRNPQGTAWTPATVNSNEFGQQLSI